MAPLGGPFGSRIVFDEQGRRLGHDAHCAVQRRARGLDLNGPHAGLRAVGDQKVDLALGDEVHRCRRSVDSDGDAFQRSRKRGVGRRHGGYSGEGAESRRPSAGRNRLFSPETGGADDGYLRLEAPTQQQRNERDE